MSAAEQDKCHDQLGQLRAEVAALSTERRRLVETLLMAERDRQLLGYELHDGIVQDLSAAAMLLEGSLAETESHSQSLSAALRRSIDLVRGSIVEARRLVGGLAAVELADATLGEALQRLVERYRTQYNLDAHFTGDCHHLGLSPAARYLLLRIAQEALNNAWKHAPTCRVAVCLAANDETLDLTIEDCGPGFDPRQSKPGHFGLDGMRARAHLLGAELRIDSGAGKGTRICVRVPRPTKPSSEASTT